MQSLQRFSAAAFVALAVCGCAGPRILDIDSKPPGATIYINGEKRGTTRSQVVIDFDSASRLVIQIVKPRYKPVLLYFTEDQVENLTTVLELEAD